MAEGECRGLRRLLAELESGRQAANETNPHDSACDVTGSGVSGVRRRRKARPLLGDPPAPR